MGLAFSQIILGFHAALEAAAGFSIFHGGVVPASMDPVEAKKTSGNDKLWKRWQAGGLLAMAYVGYAGYSTSSEDVKTMAVETSALFHLLAAGAQVLAANDGVGDFASATIKSLHLYLAVGFGAVKLGLLD